MTVFQDAFHREFMNSLLGRIVSIMNKVNLAGWLNLVDYKAREQKAIGSFTAKKRDELIPKLRKVFSDSHVLENTCKLLNDTGIKLVVQEKPERTPVDGVAFWCDKHPTIGLTRRYD